MDQAVLTEYDTYVLVDRSGSMSLEADGFNDRWEQAKEITLGIANLAQKVDEDGITVIAFGGTFVKGRDVQDGVKRDAIIKLFADQEPGGSTPMAEALNAAIDMKLSKKKKAVIFVIGDGAPDDSDAVEAAIIRATKKIGDASEIRILLLQVGQDAKAAKFLAHLDTGIDEAKFDIVNTIGFKEANGLTPSELYQRALLDTH